MKKVVFVILILFISIVYARDIDAKEISSIKLNSISVDSASELNHIRFSIKAKKASNFEPIIDIRKASKKSLEHFFIGLSVPEEKFWVNLNPKEPFRIIDSTLGNTDLGRIMLKADLELKEDTCELTNPQTSPIGREFWKRLYAKAEELGMIEKIPVVIRLWIVPAEAVVYERENQLSIIKSKLRVCLESAYLTQKVEIKDKRQRELQDYASSLMEELILPILNKKVNEDYSYADLREVYNALILARWYKDKFSYQRNSLLQMVNANILEDTEIDLQYSPDKIYEDYLRSLKQGEYSLAETSGGDFGFYSTVVSKHYFSGGIDFRGIKITRVDNSSQTQTEEDAQYFTCDLYLPQGIERPLKYAKNNLELTEGIQGLGQDISVALAKSLPAIAPVRFAEQSIQSLDYAGKTDRLVLSKL